MKIEVKVGLSWISNFASLFDWVTTFSYTQVQTDHDFCKNSDDWAQSYLEEIRGDLSWYSHYGNGVCNIGNNGGPDACAQICAGIPDCKFFSTSTISYCYACFIYKSCDSPFSRNEVYQIYEMESEGIWYTLQLFLENHVFWAFLSLQKMKSMFF